MNHLICNFSLRSRRETLGSVNRARALFPLGISLSRLFRRIRKLDDDSHQTKGDNEEEKKKKTDGSTSSFPRHSFPSSILPLGGVEERTLEALGAVDEGHHEDVGQRGFDGHEDLFARGEREVRGWGLRRCGRHLASNLELLRASVRAKLVVCAVVWASRSPLRSCPTEPTEKSDRLVSCRRLSPLCVATHRPSCLPPSPSLSLSVSRSLVPTQPKPDDVRNTTATAMYGNHTRR